MAWRKRSLTRSSASMHSTQSWAACLMANCFWGPKPRHSASITRAPRRRANSTVPSVLPLSTTRISSQKTTDARQASSGAAAFLVMRTAESCGMGRAAIIAGQNAILRVGAARACRFSSSRPLPSATSSTTCPWSATCDNVFPTRPSTGWWKRLSRSCRSFADGLIAEAVEDLWEPWMRYADQALEDETLLLIIQQELAKRCKKSKTRGRRATSAEVVLRMMLLKHVRDWSYEELSREVRANLVYRE